MRFISVRQQQTNRRYCCVATRVDENPDLRRVHTCLESATGYLTTSRRWPYIALKFWSQLLLQQVRMRIIYVVTGNRHILEVARGPIDKPKEL